MGHIECLCSHGSIHHWWNTCRHTGGHFTISPFCYSYYGMAVAAAAAAAACAPRELALMQALMQMTKARMMQDVLNPHARDAGAGPGCGVWVFKNFKVFL